MTKFYPDGLPQELKDAALWCVWRYERREGQDKPTKVPYNARTGGRAMSNSPSTFTSYQTAVKALERGGYDGLGVGVFNGLCAIDIDDCLDENGTPSPLARDIVSTMQSYTETSPSGRGIRIFFKAADFPYDKARYQDCDEKMKCGALALKRNAQVFKIPFFRRLNQHISFRPPWRLLCFHRRRTNVHPFLTAKEAVAFVKIIGLRIGIGKSRIDQTAT